MRLIGRFRNLRPATPRGLPVTDILSLRSVTKAYGNVTILNNLNLDVRDGEFLALLGPSGSGKTTVLRLIGGFEMANSGQILLDGTNITSVPINKRPFHTVFQDYALFPHMTVAANIGYGLSVRGASKAEVTKRVSDALDLVQLGRFANRYPAQLSGGQRQRVALARAIICEPRLVLLDEPLAALDFALRHQMQQFLKDVQRRIKTTFVFVTHDQEEAMNVADRICVMNAGHIDQIGTAREIYHTPHTEFVAGFFGENNLIPASRLTSDSATFQVDTPLGQFQIGRPPSGSGRRDGVLSIRPEALKVNAANMANRFAARVKENRFSGASTIILLEAQAGDRIFDIKVRAPADVAFPNECEEVMLGFAPTDGHLVMQ